MSKILVCGLVNVETTVSVSDFPIEYCPIDYNFFGVESNPSGVGLNLSLSFNKLSDEVRLLSMVSDDTSGVVVRDILNLNGISTEYLQKSTATAQSVVLYDKRGKRRIFCDLKDLQETSYDETIFRSACEDSDILCLCNINFSRNLLKIAKELNKCIATDVHVLSDVNDEYNRDYIQCADILFLSNENIKGVEKEFMSQLKDIYNNKIIVCGMGKEGALMYTRYDDSCYHQKAVKTRDVVNTVGAGDAMFSSFVHFIAKGTDPKKALFYATVYASYKIGESGGAKGFLSEKELINLADCIE